MNLMNANKQWSTRPTDERFDSIESLEENAKHSMEESFNMTATLGGLSMVGDNEQESLALASNTGRKAAISHLASRQLARRLEIPNGIFDTDDEDKPKFSPSVIADLVNDRIKRVDKQNELKLYSHKTDDTELPVNIRCITSDKYVRVHDYNVIQGIKPMLTQGWKVPPARPAFENQTGTRKATEADILKLGNTPGLNIKVGDPIAPAGLYRGDQDMFVILTDDANPIDDGSGRPLIHSRIITNSEVGEGSFSIMEIIHDTICGNHCIWGVNKLVELRYRHLGTDAFTKIMNSMRLETIARPDFKTEIAAMKWMRRNRLGETTKEVVEKVYGFNLGQSITKKLLTQSLALAEGFRGIDSDPFTYAGLFQSVTRQSQLSKNESQRLTIDREIGGLMSVAKKEMVLA